MIIHTTWKVKGLAFMKMDKSEEQNVRWGEGGSKLQLIWTVGYQTGKS